MALRPKRKLISVCYQERFLQEFYDQLDEDGSEFLGHYFAGEDGDNDTFGSDSNSDSN